jgi:hypothetical protein
MIKVDQVIADGIITYLINRLVTDASPIGHRLFSYASAKAA